MVLPGCRAGGVATLRLENLDLDKLEAAVTEKGSKSRPVWFGDVTAAALERWLRERPRTDHSFVFCSTRTPYQQLLSESVSNIVERAAIAAGIERPIHSHALRHWKADKLSQVTDAQTASIILGHADPMITMQYYYHADLSRAKNAVQTLAIQPNSIPKMQF